MKDDFPSGYVPRSSDNGGGNVRKWYDEHVADCNIWVQEPLAMLWRGRTGFFSHSSNRSEECGCLARNIRTTAGSREKLLRRTGSD